MNNFRGKKVDDASFVVKKIVNVIKTTTNNNLMKILL